MDRDGMPTGLRKRLTVTEKNECGGDDSVDGRREGNSERVRLGRDQRVAGAVPLGGAFHTRAGTWAALVTIMTALPCMVPLRGGRRQHEGAMAHPCSYSCVGLGGAGAG